MWSYQASVLRVVDGDTVDLCVDLGFDVQFNMRVRIAGIDTPELNSSKPEIRARALSAKTRVAELLPIGLLITMTTEKDRQEKYGRYLAAIQLPDGQSLGPLLIAEGLATAYGGGARI